MTIRVAWIAIEEWKFVRLQAKGCESHFKTILSEKNINSTFVSQGSVPTTVTSSNAFADQGVLFVNVDTARTYQEHFVGTGSEL